MSWEVLMDKEYPCPCSKSTCRVVTKMNDWNRTEEEVTMNCPECRVKYKMKHSQSSDGGENWKWEEIDNSPKQKRIQLLGTWVDID